MELQNNATLTIFWNGDTVELIYFHPTMLRGRFENIQRRRFRLYGIDSPEIHSKDGKEKEEGLKSKQFISNLILFKVVNIKFTKNDKFGREMGDIIYKGEIINKKMIDSGHARPYFGHKKEASIFD